MVDYRKLYSILCGAIDDSLDALEKIPQAREEAEKLKNVLLKTEEIYIRESEDDS